jgi:hypothetical protein
MFPSYFHLSDKEFDMGGIVTRMAGKRNAYRAVVGKPVGKRPL